MVQTPWYVVQVRAGKEAQTCQLIESIVDVASELTTLCGSNDAVLTECFVPQFQTQIKLHGRWTNTLKPMFPGYVIAATEHIEMLSGALASVPQFTRVLKAGETFVPLADHERALIDALTVFGKRTVDLSWAVVEDGLLTVARGPLMYREGWIKSFNRRRSTAVLETEMLDRVVTARVGLAVVGSVAQVPA